MTQTPYFTTLKNRGQLILSGQDSVSFLQDLISNDIERLNTQSCVYSCLLSPQGKFLYDFCITQENDAFILDCEGGTRAHDLARLLNMYKLRAYIDIKVIENNPVYAIMGTDDFGYKDPRHPDLGYRSLSQPTTLPEKSFDYWDKHRLSLCIPDGSRDMIPNKSTMDEGHMDKLNAISYDKGCYIGQELTARMHYRGLGKKHLYVITPKDIDLKSLPDFGVEIIKDGKVIGEMRSSCDDIGLALLKDEYALKA